MEGIRAFFLCLITFINIIGSISIYFFLYNKDLKFSKNESMIIFFNIFPIFFSLFLLLDSLDNVLYKYCPDCCCNCHKGGDCCKNDDYDVDYDDEYYCKSAILLLCIYLAFIIFIKLYILLTDRKGEANLRKISLGCIFIFELIIIFFCKNLYLGESNEKKYLIILIITLCLIFVNSSTIILHYFCNFLGEDSPKKDNYLREKKNEH